MMKTEVDSSGLWASDETHKFDVRPGIWVEIKRELDHGEEQQMQAAAMKGITRQQIQNAVDEADTQDVILMDSARLHFLKMAYHLLDWNLPDQQGRPITLPSRVEDRIKIVRRLSPRIGTKISEEIDKVREEKAKELEDPNDASPTRATTETKDTPSTTAAKAPREITPNGVETPTGVIS